MCHGAGLRCNAAMWLSFRHSVHFKATSQLFAKWSVEEQHRKQTPFSLREALSSSSSSLRNPLHLVGRRGQVGSLQTRQTLIILKDLPMVYAFLGVSLGKFSIPSKRALSLLWGNHSVPLRLSVPRPSSSHVAGLATCTEHILLTCSED